MSNRNQWGQTRTNARTRRRNLQVAAVMLVILALPFLLDAASRLYVQTGGAARGRLFPLWFSLGFWAAELTVAIGGACLIFRASDEFERRALAEAAGLAGGALILLLPPLIFTGRFHGLGASDATMGLWALALISGAFVYRARLRRR